MGGKALKKFLFLLMAAWLLVVPAVAQRVKRTPSKPGTAAPKAPPAPPKVADVMSAEEQEAAALGRITPAELRRKLDAKADVVIIDARDGRSWIGSAVKIKGALHITLSQLEERLNELPKDKEIITYCT